MDDVVERVITAMWGKLGDRITVDDLARTARFSKFHFTRVFQRATGVSPGRFLSALRLEEAKRLLIATSMSVTDISYRVGYTSVGTSTSRFTASVGVSPTRYRRNSGYVGAVDADEDCGRESTDTTVSMVIHAPEDTEVGPIFVGLFGTRIPEGRPVRCAQLDQPGPYRFEGVPSGRWYLSAVVRPPRAAEAALGPVSTEDQPLVGIHGPFNVYPGVPVIHADVHLGPMRSTHPPILLALLETVPRTTDEVRHAAARSA